MALIEKLKPFSFKQPKPPPEPSRLYNHQCPACLRTITLDTSKPGSGLCSCGFVVLIENEYKNDFHILTTKKGIFE